MKLVQKRFPVGSVAFEIADEVLRVESKSPLRSQSYEIPFRDIGTTTSKVRQFPLVWFIFAALSSCALVASVVGLFVAQGDSKLGMGALVVMSGVFSALAWYGFFERRIDFVIIHSREAGHALVYLRRTSPSVRHVEEFVEILKERSEASKL